MASSAVCTDVAGHTYSYVSLGSGDTISTSSLFIRAFINCAGGECAAWNKSLTFSGCAQVCSLTVNFGLLLLPCLVTKTFFSSGGWG